MVEVKTHATQIRAGDLPNQIETGALLAALSRELFSRPLFRTVSTNAPARC
jgi:hypothetical protein